MFIKSLLLGIFFLINSSLLFSYSSDRINRSIDGTSSVHVIKSEKNPSCQIVKCCKDHQPNQRWFYDNFLELIGTLITLIGFFFAIQQLNRQAKTMEGELALKLDDKLYQHRVIYKELYPGGAYYDSIQRDKIEDIEYYLTFYDTLSILVKNHQIKLDQINRLYGFRFLTVMHNKNVQKIVEEKLHSWAGLNWLYPRILEIRKKQHDEIPRQEQEWKNFLTI